MVATTVKQGSRSEHRTAAIGRGITYVLLLLGSVLFMCRSCISWEQA